MLIENLLPVHKAVTRRKRLPRTLTPTGPPRPESHVTRETDMRALMRNLIEKGRRLSGTGAERNAHMEIDKAHRSVIELDRQLRRVCETPPRRAA